MPKIRKDSNTRQSTVDVVSTEMLRHSEYYGLQETFDSLYARSKDNSTFENLMEIILSRENILLAYRNIKSNDGSHTPGTDNVTIREIGKLSPESLVHHVRYIVAGKPGYHPKPVRRKEIPKENGDMRPLGIPCMWDRLIQQCVKQVIEPICEAKFSDNSYGFRPTRSVEHAIASSYRIMQRQHLHYVIEFDIKGFFDNVNHTKLIRQIWALGIHDKQLIYIIRQILKAPIRMPDGTTTVPVKGTPQGGIISPLLANIVLNELDHWVESQWLNNPVTQKYPVKKNKSGSEMRSDVYRKMRRTRLKEMYIVRYADDFRIFCRTLSEARKVKEAVAQWLEERLKLTVSENKTRIVNAKRKYTEFLGFKMRLHTKGDKYVIQSHMCDKAIAKAKRKLLNQAKNICYHRDSKTESDEVRLYNAMVMGIHNYYQIATDINLDCEGLHRSVMTVLTNRMKGKNGGLCRHGRKLTKYESAKYGKSKTLRYTEHDGEPIYPIGYIQTRYPLCHRRNLCCYTAQGRIGLHNNLRINTLLMLKLMKQPQAAQSAEYADNRISLFSAQWGNCYVTHQPFSTVEEIHCHHIIPRKDGGGDQYSNLCLVSRKVHELIHATVHSVINQYLRSLSLDVKQMARLNTLRAKAGYEEITVL